MVGDLQRSRAERAGRTTDRQQPEHQAIFREFHGSANSRCTGPFAAFSDRLNRAFLPADPHLSKYQRKDWQFKFWQRRLNHDTQSAEPAFFSSSLGFLGARSLG